MRSVWSYWLENASEHPLLEIISHVQSEKISFRWTWQSLMNRAEEMARQFYSQGVRCGDNCGVMLRHDARFYPVYLAICALGAIPSVLAYPNRRLHPEKFQNSFEGMSRKSGMKWLFTERSLAEIVQSFENNSNDSTIAKVFFPYEEVLHDSVKSSAPLWPESGAHSVLLLQHSSGTTGLQKGVELSHSAVIENITRYGRAIKASASDKIVTWLPLYHDMGLIAAFHLPLLLNIPIVQLDPFEWSTAPHSLLEIIESEKGTLSWMPNFAFDLIAAKVPDRPLSELHLNSLRMLISCSEPVRSESFAKLKSRLRPKFNVPFAACYAMAEMTFAVSQTDCSLPVRELFACRESLEKGLYLPASVGAESRKCVSSGKVIEGVELKIVDHEFRNLPDSHVGEIILKSVSMFSGYRNDPQKSADAFRDGWFLTGDYGFVYESELYVIGRKKDTIIVAGKNIAPEDVESIVNEVEGVIPGRCVAVGIYDSAIGTERVAVIAETDLFGGDNMELSKLKQNIMLAAMQIEITVGVVYLVAPRWLVKSSSGKLSRQTNRDRILERERKSHAGHF